MKRDEGDDNDAKDHADGTKDDYDGGEQEQDEQGETATSTKDWLRNTPGRPLIRGTLPPQRADPPT